MYKIFLFLLFFSNSAFSMNSTSFSSMNENSIINEDYGLFPSRYYTAAELAENPFIRDASPMAKWGLQLFINANVGKIYGQHAIDWARKNLRPQDYKDYLNEEGQKRRGRAELEIEKGRLDLGKEERTHVAELKRVEILAGIRERFSGIKEIIQDKSMLANMGVAIGGVISASMLSYFFAKNGISYLFKNKKPNIVTETSLPENIKEKIFGKKIPISRMKETVYNKELENNIINLVNSVKRAVAAGRPIGNLLFYGKPGSGKTLLARELARHSGAEYVQFSGGDLLQLPLADALQELKQIITYARSSVKPVALFIDEADAIFPDRETSSEITRAITNTFLGEFDKPSDPRIFVIFATNAPERLDSAVLSRVSKRGTVYFPDPDYTSRIKLLAVYTKKILTEPFFVANDLLEGFPTIAAQTEGWSGRDIEQLVRDALAEADHHLRTNVQLDDVLSVISIAKSNQLNAH